MLVAINNVYGTIHLIDPHAIATVCGKDTTVAPHESEDKWSIGSMPDNRYEDVCKRCRKIRPL